MPFSQRSLLKNNIVATLSSQYARGIYLITQLIASSLQRCMLKGSKVGSLGAGNATRRGKLSTVNLLEKTGCFVKTVKLGHSLKSS